MRSNQRSPFSPSPPVATPSHGRAPGLSALVGAILIALAAPSLAAAEQSCRDQIRVAAGDTLSSIARKCGTDVASLIAANSEIRNPNLVVAGTILRLPGAPEEPREEIEVASPDPLESKILLAPIRTGKGARLRVTGSGLPARTWIWIKGGWGETAHILVGRAWTDRQGSFETTVPRPRWTGKGPSPDTYKVLVEVPFIGRALMGEVAPSAVPTAEVPGPEKSPSGFAPVRPADAG
jgi:LysM repeat protein